MSMEMKHYHAKPSERLQAIQPSAVWCCANLALASLDMYSNHKNAHVQLHTILQYAA